MPLDTSARDPIPETEPGRKPPRRLWLYAPFVALAALAIGWSVFWFVAANRLTGGIERQAEALRGAGYTIDLGRPQVAGFPFRLKLVLPTARIAVPSGWGFGAPGLEAEAYLHAPDHWVLVAPQGVEVNRPEGGGLAVKGEALRASIAGTGQAPWRIVVSGTKLVFTPAPGARPFSLASADLLEWYLRPTPDGKDGMTLVRLEGGKAAPGTLLHGIGGDGAVTASLDARLSKPEAFKGKDWAAAVRAWSGAGGTMTVVGINGAAGKAALTAKEGTLGVGGDGRLVGAIPLELKAAGQALAALANREAIDPTAAGSAAAVAAARAQGETSRLNLVFQAGATTLGPVRIGPAPKVG